MKVYCIVLHIGEVEVTKSCIVSLLKYERDFQKILVVNNDTTILSEKGLQGDKVMVINNKKNLGYAGGMNVGITYALNHGADAVLLLNNDTYIKKPCIKTLVNIFMTQPQAGIVGPAICFKKNKATVFDVGGYVQMWTGRTRHSEVTTLKGQSINYPDYITGAALCIKKEVFEKIGLFDTNFFLYYEDVDFCLRAKKAGFTTVVEPQAIIYHHLSKTIGKVSSFAVYHQTKSAMLFGRKYMHTFPKNILHILFLFLQTAKITAYSPRAGWVGWKTLLQG